MSGSQKNTRVEQPEAAVTRELFMFPSHLEVLQTLHSGEPLKSIAHKHNITPIFPRSKYDTAFCLRGTLRQMAAFIREIEAFYQLQDVKFLFEEPLVCRFIIPIQRIPLILGIDNTEIKQLTSKHHCDIIILTPQESTSIPQTKDQQYCEMVVIGDEENVAWLHNEIETIYANQPVKVLDGAPVPPKVPPLQRSMSYLYHPSAPGLPDVSSLTLSPPPAYGLDQNGGPISPPPEYGRATTTPPVAVPPQHDPKQAEITMECTTNRDLTFHKDNIISRVLFFPESIDNLITEASPDAAQTEQEKTGVARRRRGRKAKKTNRFQEFLDYLGSAQRKLDVAIYNLTDDRVCTTLIRLHKKGVKIRIFTDYSTIGGLGNDIKTLQKHGIEVRYFKGSGFNLMHHKFTIVDDILLINGSFNYSRNAANGNHENIFITNIPVVVLQYVAQFETIYQGGTPL